MASLIVGGRKSILLETEPGEWVWVGCEKVSSACGVPEMVTLVVMEGVVPSGLEGSRMAYPHAAGREVSRKEAAGSLMRVAVAVLEPDETASTKQYKQRTENIFDSLTDVRSRPGSPNCVRHAISKRPRGMEDPGCGGTGNVGTAVGDNTYIYCRMA